MVLPPPAPLDAPGPHEPSWIERLKVILHLSERGVLVLVDGARPERLGDLVRGLLPTYPGLEVHCDARRLLGVPKGAVVVLAVDAAQAEWLNLERPVVAHRELRVLLFSDAQTSAILSRRAVDFFHWISHRVECPRGPWMPAVYTIRRALCGRAQGIRWGGGDLEEAFRAALPGRPLEYVDAAQPYAKLVEAALPMGRAWVAFTNVDSASTFRRVQWALAESGRRGRAIIVEPTVTSSGYWWAHNNPMTLDKAIAALEKAGSEHAGQLAAIMDLEPEVITIVAELLSRGLTDSEILHAAIGTTDPGLAAAHIRTERKLEQPDDATTASDTDIALSRANFLAEQLESHKGRILTELHEHDWGTLSALALKMGDIDIAKRWALRWLDTGADPAGALKMLAMVCLQGGELTDASDSLRASIALYDESPAAGSKDHAQALHALALVLMLQGRPTEAERPARQALAMFQRTSGTDHPNTVGAMSLLSDVLLREGKRFEAEQLVAKAHEIVNRTKYDDPASEGRAFRDLGHMLVQLGHYKEAEPLLQRSHEGNDDEQTVLNALLAQDLGVAAFMQGRHAEAERHLRRALSVSEKQAAHILSGAVPTLGRALAEQGKYAEAEHLLREAAQAAERGKQFHRAPELLHLLAQVIIAEGRYEEAEPLLRKALAVAESTAGRKSRAYAAPLSTLAYIYIQHGRYGEAEAMLREAVKTEEQCHGRHSESLISLLTTLAEAVIQQGRAADAEPILKRALRVAKTSANGPAVANTLKALAQLQASMGRQDAADTARRAISAFLEAFGNDNPIAQEAVPDLQDIIDQVS